MNFCSDCGSVVSLQIPARDDRLRHICNTCGIVHYQNPRVVVCAIPVWEDKVLLCRRAIEPRHGFWTLPGGFMENGESTLQAAIRETVEEACARIDDLSLYSMFNIIHINQVQLFFRARLLDLDFAPGDESLETALFSEHEVPWNDLAFPAVKSTLREYFKDFPIQQFSLRVADILLDENRQRIIRNHNF